MEYRGANYQNVYSDPSNNIFIMDPDHTEKHKVPKGQSLSEVIDDFYAGGGLDKRFLRLAIVAATCFRSRKSKFYVCWCNPTLTKFKSNSSNGSRSFY